MIHDPIVQVNKSEIYNVKIVELPWYVGLTLGIWAVVGVGFVIYLGRLL